MAGKFAFNLDDDPYAPVVCKACNKNVFPSDKVLALGGGWHKACLKCTTCKTTLNPRSLESFENKPYCKSHKPSPQATHVADSMAVKQASAAPKAARRVQGINRNARTTFAPGAIQKPIRADTGTHQQSNQNVLAPQQRFIAPEPTPSITSYANDGPLVKTIAPRATPAAAPTAADAPASYGNSAYEEGGYEEAAYEEGAYEEGAYEEGAYEEGAYEEGAYEEGAYEEGVYEEGVYEEGVYEEGAYEEEGYYEEGAYEEGGEY